MCIRSFLGKRMQRRKHKRHQSIPRLRVEQVRHRQTYRSTLNTMRPYIAYGSARSIHPTRFGSKPSRRAGKATQGTMDSRFDVLLTHSFMTIPNRFHCLYCFSLVCKTSSLHNKMYIYIKRSI